MSDAPAQAVEEPRSGRPRATSRHELERIALRLFAEQGFEETPVEQIAERAGVSKRTFFRYFESKADILWSEFDAEVEALHRLLGETPPETSVVEGIRTAVLRANHYGVEDVSELRTRMSVITSHSSLGAGATVHYDAWARALSEFAARRLGLAPEDLIPQAIGFSALGVCRAAFDQWVAREDDELITYLDQALTAWGTGFASF